MTMMISVTTSTRTKTNRSVREIVAQPVPSAARQLLDSSQLPPRLALVEKNIFLLTARELKTDRVVRAPK